MEKELAREIDLLKARVKALENTQQHIDHSITSNTDTLKEIKEALLGDDFRKDGLISSVKKNTADIEKLKSFKRTMIAQAAGACGTIVLLVEIAFRVWG